MATFLLDAPVPASVATARFPVVLFDMDGTLVDEMSAWAWVHDHFGVDNSGNLDAFIQGNLDDEAFMASDIELWTHAHGGPIHISQIEEILQKAPLMAGASGLLETLHDAGVATAIVSGGIDLLAERVAEELGIDTVIANGLATDDEGYLTGQGICRVYLEDKAGPSRKALAELGARPGQASAVGNSTYDRGMFEVAGHGIAFAPLDEEVCQAADEVVDGKDLTQVIPHLMEEPP